MCSRCQNHDGKISSSELRPDTGAPTLSPTAGPTAAPSLPMINGKPWLFGMQGLNLPPTKAVTAAPNAPSPAPTAGPTTAAPSTSPTAAPTRQPTETPYIIDSAETALGSQISNFLPHLRRAPHLAEWFKGKIATSSVATECCICVVKGMAVRRPPQLRNGKPIACPVGNCRLSLVMGLRECKGPHANSMDSRW